MRVIDHDGEQAGVMDIREAMALARQHDLDLVEVSPNATPPVCRVVDWGKYNYQKTKQQQKNKKNAKASELKQIRFGLKIGENDLDIKLRKVREFIDNGHKVKVSAFFRGREMAHRDIGYKLIERAIEKLGDDVIVDGEPIMAGRYLSVTVRSGSGAKN